MGAFVIEAGPPLIRDLIDGESECDPVTRTASSTAHSEAVRCRRECHLHHPFLCLRFAAQRSRSMRRWCEVSQCKTLPAASAAPCLLKSAVQGLGINTLGLKLLVPKLPSRKMGSDSHHSVGALGFLYRPSIKP